MSSTAGPSTTRSKLVPVHIATSNIPSHLLPIPNRAPQDAGPIVTAAHLMREGHREFDFIKSVGDGSFGTVFLADWRSPLPSGAIISPMQHPTTRPEYVGKRLVAIKKMKKTFKSWDECMLLKELKSLLAIPRHPSIIPLYDAFLSPTSKELHFVFESMEGNLYQLTKCRKGRSLALGLLASIFLQMIRGLIHIHDHGYFHRDMKPENLLLTTLGLTAYPTPPDIALTSPITRQDATREPPPESDVLVLVKLADFGLAREVDSVPPYTEYVSTRWYRAPEVLLRSRDYNAPVDIWALGAILAELVNLRPLFPGSSEVDQILQVSDVLGDPYRDFGRDERGRKVGGGEWSEGVNLGKKVSFAWPFTTPYHFPSLFRAHMPLALVDAIQGMLIYHPTLRLTALQAVNTPFFLHDIPRLLPRTDVGTPQVQAQCRALHAAWSLATGMAESKRGLLEELDKRQREVRREEREYARKYLVRIGFPEHVRPEVQERDLDSRIPDQAPHTKTMSVNALLGPSVGNNGAGEPPLHRMPFYANPGPAAANGHASVANVSSESSGWAHGPIGAISGSTDRYPPSHDNASSSSDQPGRSVGLTAFGGSGEDVTMNGGALSPFSGGLPITQQQQETPEEAEQRQARNRMLLLSHAKYQSDQRARAAAEEQAQHAYASGSSSRAAEKARAVDSMDEDRVDGQQGRMAEVPPRSEAERLRSEWEQDQQALARAQAQQQEQERQHFFAQQQQQQQQPQSHGQFGSAASSLLAQQYRNANESNGSMDDGSLEEKADSFGTVGGETKKKKKLGAFGLGSSKEAKGASGAPGEDKVSRKERRAELAAKEKERRAEELRVLQDRARKVMKTRQRMWVPNSTTTGGVTGAGIGPAGGAGKDTMEWLNSSLVDSGASNESLGGNTAVASSGLMLANLPPAARGVRGQPSLPSIYALSTSQQWNSNLKSAAGGAGTTGPTLAPIGGAAQASGSRTTEGAAAHASHPVEPAEHSYASDGSSRSEHHYAGAGYRQAHKHSGRHERSDSGSGSGSGNHYLPHNPDSGVSVSPSDQLHARTGSILTYATGDSDPGPAGYAGRRDSQQSGAYSGGHASSAPHHSPLHQYQPQPLGVLAYGIGAGSGYHSPSILSPEAGGSSGSSYFHSGAPAERPLYLHRASSASSVLQGPGGVPVEPSMTASPQHQHHSAQSSMHGHGALGPYRNHHAAYNAFVPADDARSVSSLASLEKQLERMRTTGAGVGSTSDGGHSSGPIGGVGRGRPRSRTTISRGTATTTTSHSHRQGSTSPLHYAHGLVNVGGAGGGSGVVGSGGGGSAARFHPYSSGAAPGTSHSQGGAGASNPTSPAIFGTQLPPLAGSAERGGSVGPERRSAARRERSAGGYSDRGGVSAGGPPKAMFSSSSTVNQQELEGTGSGEIDVDMEGEGQEQQR